MALVPVLSATDGVEQDGRIVGLDVADVPIAMWSSREECAEGRRSLCGDADEFVPAEVRLVRDWRLGSERSGIWGKSEAKTEK